MQKTGVVTASWVPSLAKFIIVISTPTVGCSTVGNFDTYFLESDVITGPYALVSYLPSFGPEAYFVHIPSKFMSRATGRDVPPQWRSMPGAAKGMPIVTPIASMATADPYWQFFLSYSADFASGAPNPPGSGYHWSLLRSRFALAPDYVARLQKTN